MISTRPKTSRPAPTAFGRRLRTSALSFLLLSIPVAAGSCTKGEKSALTIGVAFETLQTPYWETSLEAIRADLEKRGIRMLEAVAEGDASRQFEQVQSFIARGVDGIIIAPKDASTVIPMIKAANRAEIPIVLYNRPPGETDAKSVTVVADNRKIAYDTVKHLCELARERGHKHKAMVLVGDLGDLNAVNRKLGFEDAVAEHPEVVEIVSQVATEWNQEKALAGVESALQRHPDIDFVFSSSDFLFPSLVSQLAKAEKYKKVGEEGHVILGGFDGDQLAYEMLVDGYLDADGVQDVYFECSAAVQAVLDLRAKKPVDSIIEDPGFVAHRKNLAEVEKRMWGARLAATKG